MHLKLRLHSPQPPLGDQLCPNISQTCPQMPSTLWHTGNLSPSCAAASLSCSFLTVLRSLGVVPSVGTWERLLGLRTQVVGWGQQVRWEI